MKTINLARVNIFVFMLSKVNFFLSSLLSKSFTQNFTFSIFLILKFYFFSYFLYHSVTPLLIPPSCANFSNHTLQLKREIKFARGFILSPLFTFLFFSFFHYLFYSILLSLLPITLNISRFNY